MTLHLDPLPQVPIVGKDGTPTQAFQRLWQKTKDALMAQEAAQDQVIADLSAVVADLVIAQATADAAQADATAAAREMARINSYPDPTNVLTAADVGASATITITGHDRVYPVQGAIDVPDVTVAGGSIAGLAFSTQYAVYYDDATLADTTPTYLATTVLATAQVGAAAGRHFVGVITTPADGAGGTGGTGGGPPGGGGGFPLP